jgi:phosphatidylglycerophosphatase A
MGKQRMSKESELVFSSPTAFLAFGFGSGLAPKAPGTFGTLAALPILLLLAPFHMSPWFGLFLLATFGLGIYLCDTTADALGVHDHGGIVWDEFVGLWITFWGVALTPLSLVLGFALFRLFDIVKPFPIRWLDKKVPGGLGIMIDDVLAGVFAWLALQGILILLR